MPHWNFSKEAKYENKIEVQKIRCTLVLCTCCALKVASTRMK